MTGGDRAMDDLDRLAFRLVRTIRQHHPELIDHGFSLSDLEVRLLPFREARREMADGGVDAWERTVLRLLGGEREYVRADDQLRRACLHALTLPSPTLALVRSWSGALLALGEAASGVGLERLSGAVDAQRRTTGAAPADRLLTPLADGTSPPPDEQLRDGATARGRAAFPCCRYCGGRLPRDRGVTFCPHCGLDQTKRQCPACSTEIEAAWRFCATCGRSADLPDADRVEKRLAS